MSSYIEKGFLSLFNNQKFFKTDNLDIFDLPIFKHSFNFLKKDDKDISLVNTESYLKKSTNSLRNVVDNDLFSVAPRLDEIENL